MTFEAQAYAAFAARLTTGGGISDPWLDGRPRFRPEPVVLTPEEKAALDRAAEEMASAWNELCLVCASRPELVSGFLGLSEVQQALWWSSAPHWHGIARADVFFTESGPRVCELNCDTPSGEAEAVLLNQAALVPGFSDPNAALAGRFCAMIEHLGRSVDASAFGSGPSPAEPAPPRAGGRERLTVGIVYPTEITEDLSMVLLYQQWFEERGFKVVLGSPFNLCALPGRRAGLFGTACDVFVRHYKTDWWSERRPAFWDAPPLPDPEPLTEQLGIILGSVLHGKAAVVNPFGAVVPQNKRAMALFWERPDLFSEHTRSAVRRYLPETVRLESLDKQTLLAKRASWVLKSDYGCEGDEVVIGAEVDADVWEECLDAAVPGRWVAQRYFRAAAESDGSVANHGVYLVAGRACGLYTRLSSGATDRYALSAPVLVRERALP